MFARILLAVVLASIGLAAAARAPHAAGPERAYVVKPGDTLWGIAEREYGGDPRAAVWTLQQRNELAGPTIEVGQRLVLP
jgi:hypothetical protein